MNITLDAGEIMTAATAGAWRQARGIIRGRQNAHGFNGDGWRVAIEGLAAEIAVAKALNAYHPSFYPELDRARGDVDGLHVRSSSHPSAHLTIYRDDPDGAYVLVVGQIPAFRIPGWIFKQDAVRGTWWRDDIRDPAFWVPQDALSPLETIPARQAA